MRKLLLLLIGGLVAGVAAFATAYLITTHQPRRILREPDAGLAWLKHEFRLGDEEFQRIAALHQAYQPTCAELCRRIAEQNGRLAAAVVATNVVTEEIAALVRETGRVRDDCRQAMLAHLYAVAKQMPPETGRRYLEVMLRATCVLEEPHPMAADAVTSTAPHPAPGHGHHE